MTRVEQSDKNTNDGRCISSLNKTIMQTKKYVTVQIQSTVIQNVRVYEQQAEAL